MWLLEFGTAWLTAVSARHGTVCPHPTSQQSIRENPEWPNRPDNWHGFATPPPLPRKFILNVCCFGCGWGPCLRAMGPSERTIRLTWHIAVLLSQKLFIYALMGYYFLYLFMVYVTALSVAETNAASDCMMKTTEIWRRVVWHSDSQSVVRETVSSYDKLEVKMLYWIFDIFYKLCLSGLI